MALRWLLFVGLLSAQTDPGALLRTGPALLTRDSPLKPALELLREGKTAPARAELARLLKTRPDDAEIHFQIARSHLIDFNTLTDPAQSRLSLSLAIESLAATLNRNPDHVYALRIKSILHARAELLYYDPNLAFELANRVVKLQPFANEYLITLAEWLSGEVRLSRESGQRVPHDPLIALDRSIELLERVVEGAMPFSNEEGAALFLLGKSLAARGNFKEALPYFSQALPRATTADQRLEILRETGASHYRLGAWSDAASSFYNALQVRNNSIDQWLLRAAMDQIKGPPPPLPERLLFPVAEPLIDKANPPLIAFEDVAAKIGLRRMNGNGTAAWGDFDGDGDEDLIVSGSATFVTAYRNDGGKFTDCTAAAGLANVPSGYSLNLVDYDNDGRLDLYISLNGWSGPMPNRLFHNQDGRFVDVSASSGLADPGSGFVSLWGDLDNDGWLDVVIANGVLKDGSTPQIYRNNRDGTFTNVTRPSGIVEPPTYGTIGAALGDFDKDGDLDILFNGLNNSPNRLYRNEGQWKFTEIAARAGLAQPPHNGFVCFFFDYDNDAWPDVLTVSLAPWDAVVQGLSRFFQLPGPQAVHPDATRLFRNNRNGAFTDTTFAANLAAPMGGMGAGVADLDNDGFLDIYIGTGDPQLSRLEPNRLWRNRGDGTFHDLTRFANLARPGNKGHGVAFIDLDADGALDIFAQLGGHYQGDHAENAFYRNLKAQQNHWLLVEGAPVGTQITLSSGDLKFYRERKGSEGFGATNSARLHFGLGRVSSVSVDIRWPNGKRDVLPGVKANQILRIKP